MDILEAREILGKEFDIYSDELIEELIVLIGLVNDSLITENDEDFSNDSELTIKPN